MVAEGLLPSNVSWDTMVCSGSSHVVVRRTSGAVGRQASRDIEESVSAVHRGPRLWSISLGKIGRKEHGIEHGEIRRRNGLSDSVRAPCVRGIVADHPS